MGFKFRKRIKVIPGVNVNISKSGISTSIGKPGATVNISKKGVKGTVGIPGSGISFTKNVSKDGKEKPEKMIVEVKDGVVMPWEEFSKLPFETRMQYLEDGGKVGKKPLYEKVSIFILLSIVIGLLVLIF